MPDIYTEGMNFLYICATGSVGAVSKGLNNSLTILLVDKLEIFLLRSLWLDLTLYYGYRPRYCHCDFVTGIIFSNRDPYSSGEADLCMNVRTVRLFQTSGEKSYRVYSWIRTAKTSGIEESTTGYCQSK
jgi:hypothetical protein